jgi:Na+/H+-translocating membrane pyrophosphatase
MQYAVLSFFKEHHKELGRVYYSNYYSFNVVLTIATIILAILVFLIANKGWQTSDIFLKISFCTVFFISSLLGILTITLGQKENYESNFKQYLYYDKIQTNIITFVNTTDQYKPSRVANLTDSFIVAISSDLRANGQFFMAIDANKISFDDISGKLGKSLNGKP